MVIKIYVLALHFLGMVWLRIKNVKGKDGNRRPYLYLCKSIREGKKVRSVTLKYLGKVEGLEIIDKETIKHIFERDDYKCKFCGKERDLILDHIIPLSKNGNNNIENLQVLCMKCNDSKGNKNPPSYKSFEEYNS